MDKYIANTTLGNIALNIPEPLHIVVDNAEELKPAGGLESLNFAKFHSSSCDYYEVAVLPINSELLYDINETVKLNNFSCSFGSFDNLLSIVHSESLMLCDFSCIGSGDITFSAPLNYLLFAAGSGDSFGFSEDHIYVGNADTSYYSYIEYKSGLIDESKYISCKIQSDEDSSQFLGSFQLIVLDDLFADDVNYIYFGNASNIE